MNSIKNISCSLLICCSASAIVAQECGVETLHKNNFLKKTLGSGFDQLCIPVVVHVVYYNPETNISNSQVFSQIDALNKDFNLYHSAVDDIVNGFKNDAAEANILFYLTEVDPEGLSTDGITHTSTTHGVFGNNDIHYHTGGGADAWDEDNYLNIWVCDLSAGISGYAKLPDSASGIDGVVIDYKYFGTTGNLVSNRNLGRTTTHEVGHWLGLNHIWGIEGCSDDDGIDDTPMQEEASYGCNTTMISCGSLNMSQNFMDYSDDNCRLFFTNNQVEVMRTTLKNDRVGMLTCNDTLGINEAVPSQIALYPNPIKDNLTIMNERSDFLIQKIKVVDISGNIVSTQSFNPKHPGVSLTGLPNGIYFIQLITDNNEVYTSRIIKIN
ncbi:MAG: T9SS type A sorting domain-containing protein [Bacteroidetes bacterium]|nr:T9SS type A sorting domain-containing protein [Bacteroidota bacterium]